mmetsp:Transcript_21653/g.31064  ORF Transcript_21653/g.31064 Transcript_21653/m.31064 type:complete len:309 (-) Transcript_21653:1496-2422(-)
MKAVALDIDGVLLKGSQVLQGARRSIQKLSFNKVPFVFVTNGGGVSEEDKASELSLKLGEKVLAEQILLAHTPYRDLVPKFEDKKVLVLGKKSCLSVARNYGFKNVLDADYLFQSNPLCFPTRKPVSAVSSQNHADRSVEAVMIFHDPIDWSLEMQLLSDVLSDKSSGEQIPFYACNADLVYATEYHLPRFTQGAFVSAFQHLFYKVHSKNVHVKYFGKPQKEQYTYAEKLLHQQSHRLGTPLPIQYCFGVGDNPLSDIKGANEAGDIWSSILVRTGIFNSLDSNDKDNPADYVVDDVEDAVDLILKL